MKLLRRAVIASLFAMTAISCGPVAPNPDRVEVFPKSRFDTPPPDGTICWIGSDRFQTRDLTRAVCFSPDSRRLAWSTPDGVRVWEFTTPGAPREVEIPNTRILSLKVLADGDILAAGYQYHTSVLSCWRVAEAATLMFEARLPTEFYVAAFSPGGDTLAVLLRNGELLFWDVAKGKVQRRGKGNMTTGERMEFSPDGAVLGIRGYGDRAVDEFWDVATGTQLEDADDRSFEFDCKTATADGEMKFSVYKGDLEAHRADGEPIPEFWSGLQADRVVISPDGKYLAVSVGAYQVGNIMVWDTAAGRRVSDRHTAGIERVIVSPDGRRVVTTGIDMTVRMWDIESGEHRWEYRQHVPAPRFATRAKPPTIAFAPDGETVAVGHGQAVHLLDATDNSEQRQILIADGSVLWIVFAADGETLAMVVEEPVRFEVDHEVHDHSVRLVRVADGKELWRHTEKYLTINGLAFFDEEAALVGLTGRHGTHLATWNAKTGEPIRDMNVAANLSGAWATAWTPAGDGRRVATASQGKIHLWDVVTGERLQVVDTPGNHVNALSFSPDGRHLAAGIQWTTPGDAANLWLLDVKKGTIDWRSNTHRGNVRSLAFSPDGSRLVTGSEDGSALVWAMPPADSPIAAP